MSEKNKNLNMSAIRREDQRVVMEKINESGECPFCMENLPKYHNLPIIKDGKYWILTDNQWPYEKVKHQLLAIYKNHIEHISEMDPKAGKELMEMFAEESQRRNITGGGVAIRFGKSDDGTYGNSVLHLHANLIEPDLKALSQDEAWRFKFGQPKNYKNRPN